MIRYFVQSFGVKLQRQGFFKTDLRQLHSAFSCKSIHQEKQHVLSSPPDGVKMPPRLPQRKKQLFNYFLVLDFEATCNAPVNVVPQEVIEFPVIKVSGQTFETEAIFHSYVKPKVNPELTPFCTELTGIIQEMVDNEPYFEDVFLNFNMWMKQEGLFEPDVRFIFVTCGDWDLRYLLHVQCKGIRMPVPPYMRSWINVKTSFAEIAQTWPRNLTTMLRFCEVEHEGRLHSGIDDCKNIAKVLKDLADRGMVFEQNSRVY